MIKHPIHQVKIYKNATLFTIRKAQQLINVKITSTTDILTSLPYLLLQYENKMMVIIAEDTETSTYVSTFLPLGS